MFTVGPSLFGGERDPYAASVVALLHFNGTNGSTTFTDQISANTWAVIRGAPTISTAQSKFGGGSLVIPDSSPSGIRNTNAPVLLMTGDYSVEAWVYIATGSVTAFYATSASRSISMTVDSTNVSHLRGTDGTIATGDGGGSLAGRWVHAYIGRQGNNNYVACNGVMVSSTGNTSTISGTYLYTEVNTGFSGSGTAGYVDELRVTNGVCRYTASFTPPTAPFPNP